MPAVCRLTWRNGSLDAPEDATSATRRIVCESSTVPMLAGMPEHVIWLPETEQDVVESLPGSCSSALLTVTPVEALMVNVSAVTRGVKRLSVETASKSNEPRMTF